MVVRVIWRNNLRKPVSPEAHLYYQRHSRGVWRVIQVCEGQIISPYHPGNHVITTLSHRSNLGLLQNLMET